MQEIFEVSAIDHSHSTSLFEMAGTTTNPCKNVQIFLLLLSTEMSIGNARVLRLWHYWDLSASTLISKRQTSV